MKLEGRICLVTGGSRGIGEKIVKKLASDNAHVIFTYAKDKISSEKVLRIFQK